MSLDEKMQERRLRRTLKIVKQAGEYVVAETPGRMAMESAKSKVVLIVHGYNNREDDAGDSYTHLYDQLAQILPTTFLDDIWEVYWPGYWTFAGGLFSGASYPWKATAAPKIGKTLAEYFEGLGGAGKEVLFVAHSLGCRVALETIRNWVENKRCTVPGICLMAAAVPTFMLEEDAELRAAADLAERRYILHSRADFVLHWFFRPGQAWPDKGWPEAVGRFGNPRNLWEKRHENLVETNLGHSDYYRGYKKGRGDRQSVTASSIGRLFGRALPIYPRGADPYVVEWTVASYAPPPERVLPTR